LLLSLSVKSIDKIIEKIPCKSKLQNVRRPAIAKIPQFEAKNHTIYDLRTNNYELCAQKIILPAPSQIVFIFYGGETCSLSRRSFSEGRSPKRLA